MFTYLYADGNLKQYVRESFHLGILVCDSDMSLSCWDCRAWQVSSIAAYPVTLFIWDWKHIILMSVLTTAGAHLFNIDCAMIFQETLMNCAEETQNNYCKGLHLSPRLGHHFSFPVSFMSGAVFSCGLTNTRHQNLTVSLLSSSLCSQPFKPDYTWLLCYPLNMPEPPVILLATYLNVVFIFPNMVFISPSSCAAFSSFHDCELLAHCGLRYGVLMPIFLQGKLFIWRTGTHTVSTTSQSSAPQALITGVWNEAPLKWMTFIKAVLRDRCLRWWGEHSARGRSGGGEHLTRRTSA